MSDRIQCVLKYLVKGVEANRAGQSALQEELVDALPGAESVVVLPVVQGFSVELEVADLGPFSRSSFEPYVADHVLREAVNMRCDVTGAVELQLLKARFI